MKRAEQRFVVHVWLEGAATGQGQWRGSVDHVGFDRRLYFSSLGDLTDFIRGRMATPESDPAEHMKT
jgi:hypothetical protein